MSPNAPSTASQSLIVALDVPTGGAALALVDRLEGQCQWFKVGLELFIAAGPAVVHDLVSRGFSVFLDLKLHDIPNTLASAVKVASSFGVRMLTIHAAGGPAMMTAARDAVSGMSEPPELLAVTVLTSMDSAQLNRSGVNRSPKEQVELLAQAGLEAGIRGFVCSPQEASTLRALAGQDGILVTPGIRPAGSAHGDQQRIATPAQALWDGANYLVVGRPITQAANPARAAESVLAEMAKALEDIKLR